MFMNTKKEIIDWLLNNTNLKNIDDVFFTKENEQLVVNINKNIILISNDKNIKELPIKFGTVDGNFSVLIDTLESFKGFPKTINGNLNANDTSFKSEKDWNIKEINGYISLCSPDCELKNLNFLKNTKFKYFNIELLNTPFKDNKIDDNLNSYCSYNILSKYITYDKFKEYIKNNEIESNDINNYLESFDIELDKEIK